MTNLATLPVMGKGGSGVGENQESILSPSGPAKETAGPNIVGSTTCPARAANRWPGCPQWRALKAWA